MRKKTWIGLLFGAAICGGALALSQALAQNSPNNFSRGAAPPAGMFWTANPGNQQDAESSAKIHEELQAYLSAKDDDGRQAARKKIQDAFGDLFDAHQKERESEIKEIESRVARLRETLKKRDSMRRELIDHRLTTLIEDAEGLGWGTDGGASSYYPAGSMAIPYRAMQYTAPKLPVREPPVELRSK
jgi:hypothetical protein